MKQDVALDKIKSGTDAGTEIRHEVESFCQDAEIRQLRQRHRLTLQDASDLYGLSKSLLSQSENETRTTDDQHTGKAFLYVQEDELMFKTAGLHKTVALAFPGPIAGEPNHRPLGEVVNVEMAMFRATCIG
ncbi:MAG: helix-turn-helix transcriptional regulator [Desulfobacteraceae bacterium]|jgi:hypothetical protein